MFKHAALALALTTGCAGTQRMSHSKYGDMENALLIGAGAVLLAGLIVVAADPQALASPDTTMPKPAPLPMPPPRP